MTLSPQRIEKVATVVTDSSSQSDIPPIEIATACTSDEGELIVTIDGRRFYAGEKYTILEMGWAVYLPIDELPEAWLRLHGETRPAGDGWNELASGDGTLVTTHPILVALALRGWWHVNGRDIPTAPHVCIPTFDEAVQEVSNRPFLNSFNERYAGQVPGLERWVPRD
ncbi:MAG: hypothetical protein WD118_04685 [Phycisphaeraceae bacterium]